MKRIKEKLANTIGLAAIVVAVATLLLAFRVIGWLMDRQ